MIKHSIVWVPIVLNSPAYVPPAIEMADQGSSQLWTNVTTSEQTVEVLVVPLKLASATNSNPHQLIASGDHKVHEMRGEWIYKLTAQQSARDVNLR